jgi:hypothetical protein
MQHQLCPLCETRHALSEPHVWKQAEEPAEIAAPIEAADAPVPEPSAPAKMTTTRDRERFRVYMKVYMRNRRAEQKRQKAKGELV